jgi:hypothetical protein
MKNVLLLGMRIARSDRGYGFVELCPDDAYLAEHPLYGEKAWIAGLYKR